MSGDRRRALILSQTAAFVGLIVVGSWISVPFLPVPLTLQTFFVLLAGAVMRRYGAIPPALYLLMGALNLPVFHNGTAGIGILLGPTGGYLIGFVPAALLTGLAYEQYHEPVRIAGIAIGTILIYIIGVGWLSLSSGLPLSLAFIVGMLPFIPGDALKGYGVFLTARRLERNRDRQVEGNGKKGGPERG